MDEKKQNMRSNSLWRVHFWGSMVPQWVALSPHNKKVNESWLSQEANQIQSECVSLLHIVCVVREIH